MTIHTSDLVVAAPHYASSRVSGTRRDVTRGIATARQDVPLSSDISSFSYLSAIITGARSCNPRVRVLYVTRTNEAVNYLLQ